MFYTITVNTIYLDIVMFVKFIIILNVHYGFLFLFSFLANINLGTLLCITNFVLLFLKECLQYYFRFPNLPLSCLQSRAYQSLVIGITISECKE